VDAVWVVAEVIPTLGWEDTRLESVSVAAATAVVALVEDYCMVVVVQNTSLIALST
jgi:hypothetical protein